MQSLDETYHELNGKLQDFSEKAEKLFRANNWTWCDKVPNKYDIGYTLGSLIYECYQEAKKNKDHACVGTGRLQVRLNKYHEKWCGTLELVPICSRNYWKEI